MTHPFIHLHVHTAHSLSEGAIHVKALVETCVTAGMPAVAVTDTNNLFGAMVFCETAAAKGIQPILGCALSVLRPQKEEGPSRAPMLPQKDQVIVLVQNQLGYQNLSRLITQTYLNVPDPSYFCVDWATVVPEDVAGLILLTGGPDGPLNRLIAEGHTAAASAYLERLQTLFGDRLYMELTRLGIPGEQDIEAQLLTLAERTGVPIVATNSAFFLNAGMHEAHDALLCVAAGTYVDEPNRRRLTAEYYLKSPAEMARLFEDLPEALESTQHIAQRCHYFLRPVKPMLPNFPTEGGRTEEEELRYKARRGLEERLKTVVLTPDMDPAEQEATRTEYFKRLEYELDVVISMGFSGYYLIVADFIQWAKNAGIPVGPGRGSGAGSLAAWALTITDMDPIRYQLIFERFLNPERVSMPDFDVDFCQDRRDEVIRYVQERHGKDRVAHIITFGKLQAKAVLRDVGRVLQMPYNQVNNLCKLIPNIPAHPLTLQEALDQEPDLKKSAESEPELQRLFEIALQLEGLYRHASTHAAGVVIGDRPLEQLVPLYQDPRSALPATQFDMKYVEKAGLVKFDFLGLKTLTIIQKAAEFVRATGAPCAPETFPLDDEATFALLRRVETAGIFQLESAGMRDVLRRLKPERFEEIIALVALYRPGPMDDIPRYIACRHGEEEVRYPHPLLEGILKDTFGVMVYQEQVMQIAQVMANYSLGAADLLRRAMGKKIKSEMEAQRKVFVEGAVKNGMKEKAASTLFDQVAKFASYGFPKAHAAPYALIAYQTAYLKANFPVEFFAATLTYDMHNTDKLGFFAQELTRMGIPLLGPDVNASSALFSVEALAEAPHGKAVRYGLAAVKNVGEHAMQELVAERMRGGPFKTLSDFFSRAPEASLNRRQLEQLVSAGAFDSLEANRRRILENLPPLLAYAADVRTHKASRQQSLFGDVGGAPPAPTLGEIHPWSPLVQLQHECGAIGFYISAHPLSGYQEALQTAGIRRSTELLALEGQTVRVAGVLVAIQERLSKKGNRFAFLTLSDTAGNFEMMVFSEILASWRERLIPGKPLLATVTVQANPQDPETVRLTAEGIEELETLLQTTIGTLDLVCKTPADVVHLQEILAPLPSSPRGPTGIRITVPTEGGARALIELRGRYTLSLEAREALARFAPQPS